MLSTPLSRCAWNFLLHNALLSSCEATHPILWRNLWMKFFRRLPLTLRWKNPMFVFPLVQIIDAWALFLSRPLEHRKGDEMPLRPCPNISFSQWEWLLLLSNIKAKDDLKGHVHLGLVVGEVRLAPHRMAPDRALQFVEQTLTRLCVGRWLVPRVLHNLGEPNMRSQKLPNLKDLGLFRTRLLTRSKGQCPRGTKRSRAWCDHQKSTEEIIYLGHGWGIYSAEDG